MSKFLNQAETLMNEDGRPYSVTANDLVALATVNGVMCSIKFDVHQGIGICSLKLLGLKIDPKKEDVIVNILMEMNNRATFVVVLYDRNQPSLVCRASVPLFGDLNLTNLADNMLVNVTRVAKNLLAVAVPVFAGAKSVREAIAAVYGEQAA